MPYVLPLCRVTYQEQSLPHMTR